MLVFGNGHAVCRIVVAEAHRVAQDAVTLRDGECEGVFLVVESGIYLQPVGGLLHVVAVDAQGEFGLLFCRCPFVGPSGGGAFELVERSVCAVDGIRGCGFQCVELSAGEPVCIGQHGGISDEEDVACLRCGVEFEGLHFGALCPCPFPLCSGCAQCTLAQCGVLSGESLQFVKASERHFAFLVVEVNAPGSGFRAIGLVGTSLVVESGEVVLFRHVDKEGLRHSGSGFRAAPVGVVPCGAIAVDGGICASVGSVFNLCGGIAVGCDAPSCAVDGYILRLQCSAHAEHCCEKRKQSSFHSMGFEVDNCRGGGDFIPHH